MHPIILQTSVLVAYANANLQGKQAPFHKNHPAAYGYQKLKFLDKMIDEKTGFVKFSAENPTEWFKLLKKKRYSRLQINYNSRTKQSTTDSLSKLCAKADCNWLIYAHKENSKDIWVRTDQFDNYTKTVYYLLSENSNLPDLSILSIDTAKQYLTAIFSDLIKFTNRNKLKNWEIIFQNAKDSLTKTNLTEFEEYETLPKDSYSLEATQILVTCDKAWVFGGMGSWNDLSHVDDYDLYSRLTANLYDTLCKSIAAAINSYPTND